MEIEHLDGVTTHFQVMIHDAYEHVITLINQFFENLGQIFIQVQKKTEEVQTVLLETGLTSFLPSMDRPKHFILILFYIFILRNLRWYEVLFLTLYLLLVF